MKIIFWASDKPREQSLGAAFCAGAVLRGHDAEVRALTPDPDPVPCDLACMVGVKSKRLWEAYGDRRPYGHRLMLDKGYSRHRGPNRTWEYWRVSLDAQHPTSTTLMQHMMASNRLDAMGLDIRPWRLNGASIIIAGSSAKYHEFHGLPDPTEWATGLVRSIKRISKRSIIYRPKPSWQDAVPIEGTRFSTSADLLGTLLCDCFVMITHGSNACFDAAVIGVPTIVLGDAVARPISSTTIKEIDDPFRSPYRRQWAANLAYHQFTEEEFASGVAWGIIGSWMNE